MCGVRESAYIQCRKTSRFLAFHATCARKHRLLMPMKASCGAEPNTLACYCEKNTILECDWKEQQAAHEANPHWAWGHQRQLILRIRRCVPFHKKGVGVCRNVQTRSTPRTCHNSSATHYGIYRESSFTKEARFYSSWLSLLELEACSSTRCTIIEEDSSWAMDRWCIRQSSDGWRNGNETSGIFMNY